ncbi:hypothetical protein SAMN05216476_4180 [Pseudomonas mediterranea]|uniref:Integrase n=1 Tax=Pseudomonas mediterranea TaxID=183795 RepID=A0AAX2DFM6_9PSED|nr:hypothetical protein SAMN05216476_4180 [Pseudomonas mediterranea]
MLTIEMAYKKGGGNMTVQGLHQARAERLRQWRVMQY